MSLFHARRRVALAGAALLTGLVLPAPGAGALNIGGTSCTGQVLQRPFLAWGDPSYYALAPGGSFEPGSQRWTTFGAAHTVTGNEPWRVDDGTGRFSLFLPAGSAAVSPKTCISLDRRTVRFFARSTGGAVTSTLRVEVLFANTLGVVRVATIGVVPLSPAWAPTQPFAVLASALAPVASGDQLVAFRLVPQGSAAWRVDDFYIDPYRKG